MSLELSCLDELWRRGGPRREPIDDLQQEILGYFKARDTKPREKGRTYTSIKQVPLHVFVREGETMGVFSGPDCLLIRPLLGGPTPCLALEACHTGGAYAYDSVEDHLVVLHTNNSRVSVYDMKTGIFSKLYVVEGLVVNGTKASTFCGGGMLLVTTLSGKEPLYSSLHIVRLRGEGVHRRTYLVWHGRVSPKMEHAPALASIHGRVEMARVAPEGHIVITQFEIGREQGLDLSETREMKFARDAGDSQANRIWFIGERWLCMYRRQGGIRTLLWIADKYRVASHCVQIAHATEKYHYVLGGPKDTVIALYSSKDDAAGEGTVMTYYF
ncbi:Neuropathy target esterase [Perkinsus olseni]|uniref:Neuropathy target esterase n=1 Tax=Perkinsus olseni TaxID=32597 RepID=A0A7J6NH57_PEROL|nr:Neuropathy target esterase [Perkinsus olseni]KAF4750594.1 Neuropathy target esterase [Perkinsus olseni]